MQGESTSKIISAVVKPGDVCLDIGAHIGESTRRIAEKLNGKGVVYAIEPEKTCLDSLHSIVEALVINKAVGPTGRAVELYYQNNDTRYCQTIPIEGAPHTTVEQITIDSLQLDRVDFALIDVHGSALDVLNGMRKTMEKNKAIKMVISLYNVAIYNASNGKKTAMHLLQLLRQLDFAVWELTKHGEIVEITNDEKFVSRYPVEGKKRDNVVYIYAARV